MALQTGQVGRKLPAKEQRKHGPSRTSRVHYVPTRLVADNALYNALRAAGEVKAFDSRTNPRNGMIVLVDPSSSEPLGGFQFHIARATLNHELVAKQECDPITPPVRAIRRGLTMVPELGWAYVRHTLDGVINILVQQGGRHSGLYWVITLTPAR